MKEQNSSVPGGEILLYQTEDGGTRIECRFENETLWLSQAGMAELFQTSKQNIAKHLKTIFAEEELVEDAVVNYWLTTATDDKRYRVAHYKLHWAATGKTAAELIAERADHTQPNMGLTCWKNTNVRKTDVTVAKNYLNAQEIEELNRIVTMYLEYAEDQARRRQMLYMRDWREKLDAFLQFNERDILTNAGKVAKEVADRLALAQYDQFHERRLAIAAEVDERAFEVAVKKLPATPPRKKPGKPKPAKQSKKS